MPAVEPLKSDETIVSQPASRPVLKRRSIIVMIVLFLGTLGLYVPIWFLRRRAALNALDSPRKLQRWPFVIVLVWFGFLFVLGFVSAPATIEESVPATIEETLASEGELILNVGQIALGILLLVQCFIVKDILEDHLAGPEDSLPNPLSVDVVSLSGVLTFLFQIFYLQYVINKYIAVRK